MIKGILFDKDGTLVEFNSLWVNSTYTIIQTIVEQYAEDNYTEICGLIANKIGLHGDLVKEDSIIAGKTAEDLAEVIANVLDVEQQNIHEQINQFYYKSVVQNSRSIRAIGDLPALFQTLKREGLKVGIVTADNFDVTEFTIQQLNIDSYIDFIATADLYEKKPGPEAFQAFCRQFNLRADEVIHIGDTNVDMEFAKHGLLGIGVLSGVSSEQTLRKYTPHIINSVTELIDGDGKLYINKLLRESTA